MLDFSSIFTLNDRIFEVGYYNWYRSSDFGNPDIWNKLCVLEMSPTCHIDHPHLLVTVSKNLNSCN